MCIQSVGTKLAKMRKYSGEVSDFAIVNAFLVAIEISVGSYIFSLIIAYLLSVLFFGWMDLNVYHFMIIRYENERNY